MVAVIFWFMVCLLLTASLYYSIGATVGVALILSLLTWGLFMAIMLVVMFSDNGTVNKHNEELNKQLAELKAERDKIPPEYQHFKNPVYSDLSIRIADIELEQNGINVSKYKPNKPPLKWAEDDYLALAITQLKFKD